MRLFYKKIVSVICLILLVFLFIGGCTAPSSLRGSLAGNVLYTDCPPGETFQIACHAVAKQGYSIDIKNDFNHFARAYSKDTISGKKSFYVHVEVVPQPVGSKIVSRLDEFHDTKAFNFLGVYARLAGKLADEISSALIKRNYTVQRL